jgi:hypothetical protein
VKRLTAAQETEGIGPGPSPGRVAGKRETPGRLSRPGVSNAAGMKRLLPCRDERDSLAARP